ncbi:MAG: helix-turn-helix domain-containing protein [Deltaproteobacteria bacterium]|jgi:hypothetical protein|nr:helix-turn-helix domain-containing protein [Deltaproteobacteria bacterium]
MAQHTTLETVIRDTIRDIVREELALALPKSPVARVVNKEFLTSSEVEEFYGIKYQTLSNLRTKKIGPKYVKHGKSILYSRVDLETYLNEKKVNL